MRSSLIAVGLVLGMAGVGHADPNGVIKGTVIFEGDAPVRPKLVRDTDPYCAKSEKLSDDIIVNNKKVRDVLVRIQNGTTGAHASPSDPIVIDQRDCMYAPHVVGMMPGQKIQVRNSDKTFHNVRGTVAGKMVWNKPHAPDGDDLKLDGPAQPGDVLELQCDVHQWMHAYAVVQDSPWFAVTGDDGAFELKGLPAGTYTLEAWHPKLGVKTMKVVIGVGAKATVTARLSYSPSSKP